MVDAVGNTRRPTLCITRYIDVAFEIFVAVLEGRGCPVSHRARNEGGVGEISSDFSADFSTCCLPRCAKERIEENSQKASAEVRRFSRTRERGRPFVSKCWAELVEDDRLS